MSSLAFDFSTRMPVGDDLNVACWQIWIEQHQQRNIKRRSKNQQFTSIESGSPVLDFGGHVGLPRHGL
jgi:hypothetical protein